MEFSVKLHELKLKLCSLIEYVPISILQPHEQVLHERLDPLIFYIKSLLPNVIIPSILCDKNFVIIDGHHRYHALLSLGINIAPVTIIEYSSEKILTHFDVKSQLSKEYILQCATSKKLLEPKSSMHQVVINGHQYPIVLLSEISIII